MTLRSVLHCQQGLYAVKFFTRCGGARTHPRHTLLMLIGLLAALINREGDELMKKPRVNAVLAPLCCQQQQI